LLIPNFADEPDGFGTILIGALLVAFGVALGFALGFGVIVALVDGRGEVITSPSLTVTLIF
jgi:hypothetical protein